MKRLVSWLDEDQQGNSAAFARNASGKLYRWATRSWKDWIAGRFPYRQKTPSLHGGPKQLQTSASTRTGEAAGQNRDSKRSGFRDDFGARGQSKKEIW